MPAAAGSHGFMLAMGRAQPYKGFHDLLDALSILRRQAVAVPHLLLAAVTEDRRPSPYQRGLARSIAGHGLDATREIDKKQLVAVSQAITPAVAKSVQTYQRQKAIIDRIAGRKGGRGAGSPRPTTQHHGTWAGSG